MGQRRFTRAQRVEVGMLLATAAFDALEGEPEGLFTDGVIGVLKAGLKHLIDTHDGKDVGWGPVADAVIRAGETGDDSELEDAVAAWELAGWPPAQPANKKPAPEPELAEA